MSNKYNKTKISGMFDSKYGFTVKVTPEVVSALSSIKEGGYLNVNRVREETRERLASEKGKNVENTVAAYLEFSAIDGAVTGTPPGKVTGTKAKIERF